MARELLIGAASVDITPKEPTALLGHLGLRVAAKAETPITANIIVLESQADKKTLDLAAMVSCDLCRIPAEVLQLVRKEVHRRLPGFDTQKIFLNATHTHTAPVVGDSMRDWYYDIPQQGVMQVAEYQRFLAQKIADALVTAWNGRTPGSVTWGLGYAVVAQNRRAVYADGHAEMYGNTNRADFRGIEGFEDHDVGTLFFWNNAQKLVGIVVNVSCPSQEAEGLMTIHADYWHPVREALHKQYGNDVCILGWDGAAGDLSPHVVYRKSAEERMRKLRNQSGLDAIAKRIVSAVNETYDAVKNDRHADIPFVHKVENVGLPMRQVTPAEFAEASRNYQAAQTRIAKDPKLAKELQFQLKWNEKVVRRFEEQKKDPQKKYEVELHLLRIGDAAICTNPFELFTDYGIQIKARSKAVQTFVVQHVGVGTYLPTAKAVRGGGYSAIVQSNVVGAEGGQVLVDRTVELINSLWAKPTEAAKH